MTGIISSIYNFVYAIFSIPSYCCDLVCSLFRSTVPQQVARNNQGGHKPLTQPRVVDLTQAGPKPAIRRISDDGLRQRRVPSIQNSATQPSVIVRPQPSVFSTPSSNPMTQASSSLPKQLPVNPSRRPLSQIEEEQMTAQAIANSLKNNVATVQTTSTGGPALSTSIPSSIALPSNSSSHVTAQLEDFSTDRGSPVVSPSSQPVISANLTDEELMALAIANSMKKEEDVYVPQVGNKMPLQNFIDGFQVGSASRNNLTALTELYPVYQPIRGDGNCFYTTFAVDLLATFNRLPQEEQIRIQQLVYGCSADDQAKRAVLAGFERMMTGGRFGATDELMLHFVLCVRHIGADYMHSHKEVFHLDEEGIMGPLMNMWTMGECTDSGAIRAVVMAFGRPVRIFDYSYEDKEKLAQYFDIPATGVEDHFAWAPGMLPQGLHPERAFLYSGGHYSLLHKR